MISTDNYVLEVKSGPNFTGLRFTQQMTKPQTMAPYPDNHCPPSKTQGLDYWKMDFYITQMTKNAGNGITTHHHIPSTDILFKKLITSQ